MLTVKSVADSFGLMTKTTDLPASEELRALFHYDPDIGVLTWKERPPTSRANKIHNSRDAGQKAGAVDTWGHRQVRVGGKLRAAHRIIWKMMTGEDAAHQIDHINGVCDDNRWANLREATALQNAWNKPLRSTNKSGAECVFPMKTKRATSKKWRVTFGINGKRIFIGDFYTKEEAIAAHSKAFAKYRDVSFKRSPRR
jgi:hypothetical protein